jgi:molybdopterin molybdotransferase
VEEALARILERVPAGRVERVPLADAYGRVLAEPVLAPIDLPLWDNSAMDGFAVHAADVPGTLTVGETIAAGHAPTRAGPRGGAARIMTGAPMPPGADAVVMVEDTVSDGASVRVDKPARPGQHVRRRGSDVALGEPVLAPGQRLGPGAVGLLASFGVQTVAVAARPRVALVTTGDEVVPPGAPLGPGQIYGSNAHALAGLVLAAGALPVDLGNCPDDPAELRARFALAAAEADLVVSTGGVSVGDFDFVKEAVGTVDFWRVAMKPGKPLAFGALHGRPFFGLPGNPVSCMVNFLQFVRPFLRRMLGDPRPFLPVVEAVLPAPIRRAPGRVELLRVQLVRVGEALHALPAGRHQGSSNVLGMATAHGFVMLDAERTEVSGPVRVQVFDPDYDDRTDPGYAWGPAVPPGPECC